MRADRAAVRIGAEVEYDCVFAVGRRLLYAEKFSRADTLQTAVVVRIHIFSISLFSLFLRFLCCGFCDIIFFMELFGLEKLSLVDYDSHTAATVFTGGCNFRCPFCHNGSLVVTSKNDFRISEEEVLGYLTKRKGLLDGLVVTGGEPTLHKDLADFLRKVKDLGYDVKLDTNGTSPEMLASLVSSRLVDYVAMDIKSSPSSYSVVAGVSDPHLDKITESVAFLKKGSVPYEFRTTLINEFHSETDFTEIADFIDGADKYFIQKYRDSDGCLQSGFTPVPEETAAKYLSVVAPHVGYAALRGY